MRRTQGLWRELFLTLLVIAAGLGPIAAAEEPTSILVGTPAEQRAEARIRAALLTAVTVNSDGQRLEEVLARLSGQLQIPIQLDKNALEAINITGEAMVTMQVHDVSARSALQLICGKLDPTMTWTIHNEILLLTTKEAAQEEMTTRVYPVGDLVETGEDDYYGGPDYDLLIEVIQRVVEPSSWDAEGGPGAIQVLPAVRSLILTQTCNVHLKIERLLEALRQARDPARAMSAAMAAARAAEESADENTPEPDIEALLGSHAHSHAPKVDANPAPWRVPQRYED